MTKAKRYLAHVECTGIDTRDGATLTHSRYATFPAPYHHQQAEELRLAHGRKFQLEARLVSVTEVKRKKNAKPKLMTKSRTTSNESDVPVAYAIWLAKRDGIEIPHDANAVVDWSGVWSETRKNNKGDAVWEKRAQAVEWCLGGGWSRHGQLPVKVLLRIEIPNWDFNPSEPIEQIDADLPLAA